MSMHLGEWLLQNQCNRTTGHQQSSWFSVSCSGPVELAITHSFNKD